MTCAEPGCDGTVVDGYCTVCGTAPAAESTAPEGTAAMVQPSVATARSAATARTGSSRSSSTRGRLGAGIVTIPRVPKGDPAAAILTDPQVPERNRFCGNPDCGKPVGRAQNDQPGRTEGFCTQCGTPYSFVPKLRRGDLVGGQYEVQGAIAHGGLGWIYLAVDRNVHNRWVVLKGLINTNDADAIAAAAAEVLALAEVEHPNIVKIYNFVQYIDPTGAAVGYIVMEFVGGTSLKQIRKTLGAPLPPDQAVAYIIEIAPALGYLHSQGLAYCDFKPDNVMQSDEQLKLIDLGAVIRMDDTEGSLFGTVGYQAPEVAQTGPTVASDVYTVGRTLAVLVMDVPQEKGHFVETLPGPETVPMLAKYESLHRAILRATDPDPAQRFSSIEEMADQLTGVLHEIAAINTGVEKPRVSHYFSPQRAVFGAGVPLTAADLVVALSVPVVDPGDSGAVLLATTSGTSPAQLEQALTLSRSGTSQDDASSVEIPLRLVRASLELGNPAAARTRLTKLNTVIPNDWRLRWYTGQCALLEGDFEQAELEFDAVLASLPGELAPKVAIAAAAELRGGHDRALRYYDVVWRTDRGYVSAAFGLARELARRGDRAGAIAALDRVAPTSALYTTARVRAVEILLAGATVDTIDEPTLVDAGTRTSALTLESAARRATTELRVLGAALAWLQAGRTPSTQWLLGVEFTEPGVRSVMERSYRDLAHETPDVWERISLVEKANQIRPRTTL